MAMEYADVNAVYRSITADGPADPDNLPDLVPLKGTVEFIPNIDYVHTEDGDIMDLRPATVTLDAEGRLSHNGRVGVMLLSPLSSGLNPRGWQYTVRPRVTTADGLPVRIADFPIVPPPGPFRLNAFTPVPTGTLTAVTKGDKGDKGDPGDPGQKVTVSAAEPPSPRPGDLWLDIS